MKISKLINYYGNLKILEICNFDLKDVREHLIRECNLSKNYDLSKVMKKIKNILIHNLSNHSKRIEEILRKIRDNNIKENSNDKSIKARCL